MTFTHGHALVIGVGTYAHAPRANVPVTATDAQAVASLLTDAQHCGYPDAQVTALTDAGATRAALLAALDDLTHTSKDDTVLLFYGGHGDYDTTGTYCLTTNDTRWQGRRVVVGTAVTQGELLERLKRVPAERLLLIVNACHAGDMSPVLGADEEPYTGTPLPNQTANALLSTGSGRIIITACREEQYSFIGSGTHTIFAQALLDGLRGSGEEIYNRGGAISVFDLYTHLYETVTAQAGRLPENQRKRYGTQEPELTVLKGVGPFAVSLYRGASTLGGFPADHAPAEGHAVREVEPAKSQRAFQNLIQQTVRGTGAVGVVGDMDHSPIITGSGNTVTQVGGDQVNAQGAQGFVNRPTGPVEQHFGNKVGGDSIQGDFTVSGVSGTGIAIGHKAQAQAQVQQSGGSGVDLAQFFAPIYQQIAARTDPDALKAVLTAQVGMIVTEVLKGEQANAKPVSDALTVLGQMAPDLRDAVVTVLMLPAVGVSATVQRVAAQATQ